MSRMGSEISRLRKEIGLTQKELAKTVGVTEGFITEVEAGRKVLNGELLTRISKALHREVDKLDYYEEAKANKPEPDPNVVRVIEKPVQEVWHDALSGVLRDVPVYNYKMDKVLSTRKVPVIANKIEGYTKDKVFYLAIEDNDMIGFRILKGDTALVYSTQEIEKNSFLLVEFRDKRLIRHVRSVEGDKVLLVSNNGSINTQTVFKKEVKVLGRLIKLEITL